MSVGIFLFLGSGWGSEPDATCNYSEGEIRRRSLERRGTVEEAALIQAWQDFPEVVLLEKGHPCFRSQAVAQKRRRAQPRL
jgi:hypothetical protein